MIHPVMQQALAPFVLRKYIVKCQYKIDHCTLYVEAMGLSAAIVKAKRLMSEDNRCNPGDVKVLVCTEVA